MKRRIEGVSFETNPSNGDLSFEIKSRHGGQSTVGYNALILKKTRPEESENFQKGSDHVKIQRIA